MLGRTTDVIKQQLPNAENFELLCELQHDLSGFDNLVQKDRRLIRQGCLLKHSKRGLQQRMFFLVSWVFSIWITNILISQLRKHIGVQVFYKKNLG